MFAKIINEETKQCEVGLGSNSEFYKSMGFTEMEVEQAYDSQWYVKGFAPSKPKEQLQSEMRLVRDKYLLDTDKYMISDYPISDEDHELYKSYRQYLRDYPSTRAWWKKNPKTFEDWKKDNSVTKE